MTPGTFGAAGFHEEHLVYARAFVGACIERCAMGAVPAGAVNRALMEMSVRMAKSGGCSREEFLESAAKVFDYMIEVEK